jgi:putative transposase
MIDRGHDLPLIRQADLLGLSRGSLYYRPRAVPAADLAVMRRIDELHLDYPFAGSRMLRDLLRGEGISIGRERVASMMLRMGIEALYRRPHTSKPADGRKIFPYLLRGLAVDRANQVWAMDITYIPMARGFVYLAAVVDWFSRRVLSWQVSITLEVAFCLDALEAALVRYGKPAIFNTDQSLPPRRRGEANSPVLTSPACCRRTRSPSAWMAEAPGVTTCSSSASGVRSNTRRSTCVPTTASPRRVPRSVGISTSTTASVRIRALTHGRQTKRTSMPCRWSRQHDFRHRSGASLRSGYAPPTRRPRTTIHVNNRQRIHLSGAKRCSDKASHIWPLRGVRGRSCAPGAGCPGRPGSPVPDATCSAGSASSASPSLVRWLPPHGRSARSSTRHAADAPVAICSGNVVCRPRTPPRMWTATRSPLWNNSMVRAVMRASTTSRISRDGTEYGCC